MKHYEKILSLDFEMYNSAKYWSICWIGAISADANLNEKLRLDIKVNPGTKHKQTGKDIKFPFKYAELKTCGKFDTASALLFELFDEKTLVIGHAVENDVKMLLSACERYSITPPEFDYADTNVIASAMKGEYLQKSLSTLAADYGYTFRAHDPVEDAIATLTVFGNQLGETSKNIDELSLLGLDYGRVSGGLNRRCFPHCMGEKGRVHVDNYNAVFDAAEKARNTANAGETMKDIKFAIDGKLQSSQNLFAAVEWIYSEGGKVVYGTSSADWILCTEKTDTPRRLSLRDFAIKFDMPQSVKENLDFLPNKAILGGQTITYTQYLTRKYAGGKRNGVYCFARVIEKLFEYEDIAARLMKNGVRIAAIPDRGITFVVDDFSRLKDNSDHKVIMYNTLAKKYKMRVVLLSELLSAVV